MYWCSARTGTVMYCGGDTACGGGYTSGKGAQQAALFHGLGHALGQQIAKAGERDGGACSAPLYDIFIDAETSEHNAGDHVDHQNLCRGQSRPVNQNLPDEAQKTTAEKGAEIFQKQVHGLPSLLCAYGNCVADAGDAFSLHGGGGGEQRARSAKQNLFPAPLPHPVEQKASEHGR